MINQYKTVLLSLLFIRSTKWSTVVSRFVTLFVIGKSRMGYPAYTSSFKIKRNSFVFVENYMALEKQILKPNILSFSDMDINIDNH